MITLKTEDINENNLLLDFLVKVGITVTLPNGRNMVKEMKQKYWPYITIERYACINGYVAPPSIEGYSTLEEVTLTILEWGNKA